MSDTGYQPYCEKCGAPVVWCTCLDDIDWSPEMRSYLGRVRLEQQVKELRAELARRDEIITRLKEVLPTLKISHYYCEDCWYSCPKEEDGCCNEAEGEDCNCGADEHNSKIDALMKELE